MKTKCFYLFLAERGAEFIDNGDGDDMADMSLYATFDMYAQSRCLGCDAPIPFEAQLCTACD